MKSATPETQVPMIWNASVMDANGAQKVRAKLGRVSRALHLVELLLMLQVAERYPTTMFRKQHELIKLVRKQEKKHQV